MRCGRIISLLILLGLISYPQADIIHVPGELPTIQAGIDAAAEGDTVELANGTYQWDGNRDLDFGGKNLVVKSASGNPELCIIDSDGSQYDFHRAFTFHSGEGPESKLIGLGITGGYYESDYYSGGGGVHCDEGSSPTIEGCYFFGNYGGGLYCRNQSNVEVSDCRFVGNSDHVGGGASLLASTCRFERCVFQSNSADYSGGGMRCQGVNLRMYDCKFIGNVAGSGAELDVIYGEHIYFEDCLLKLNLAMQSYWSCIINFHGMVTGELVNCTVVDNTTGLHGYGIVTSKMSHGILRGCTITGNSVPSGTIIVFGELDGLVENTIIANNPGGLAMQIGSIVDISCTNIWGNPEGDWTGNIAPYLGVNGNISLDPQYCDPTVGDYSLHVSSPCAPGTPPNEECDLIGAWPVGCSTATKATSWSRVKTLY